MSPCAETPDLLDHLEGRTDLAPHLDACPTCRTALADLESALDAERALVATRPLEVEAALVSVLGRARAKRQAHWRATFFFSSAAAAALVFLLPGNFVNPVSAGPEGGGAGGTAVAAPSALSVEAPRRLTRDLGAESSATFPGIAAAIVSTSRPDSEGRR
jgi:hypothetical protein